MLKETVLDSCSALSSAASCPNRKHLSKFSPGPAMASGWAGACLGLLLDCWKEKPLAWPSSPFMLPLPSKFCNARGRASPLAQ